MLFLFVRYLGIEEGISRPSDQQVPSERYKYIIFIPFTNDATYWTMSSRLEQVWLDNLLCVYKQQNHMVGIKPDVYYRKNLLEIVCVLFHLIQFY